MNLENWFIESYSVLPGRDQLGIEEVSAKLKRWFTATILVISVGAPNLVMAYTPPVGIPNPSDFFGSLDPIEDSAPAHPSGWPESEVSGFYYIDNSGTCSDSNSFGFPNNPRCTIPEVNYAAGSYVEIHGGPYEMTAGDKDFDLDFNCTEENPCWFRGPSQTERPAIRGNIKVSGEYVFFENIFFQYRSSDGNINIFVGSSNGDADYMVFRNCEVASDGKYYPGFNSAFSTNGLSATDKTTHIVFYDNEIHHLGDANSDIEDDYHGILPASYSEYIWALGNHIHDNGGDSMQIGSNNYTSDQMPRYIFVGGNEFHSDLENAVDIKNARDVIVSSNEFYDYHIAPASDGAAVVIHQQNGDIPEFIWIIFNKIHDAARGIRAQQAENVKIVGNVIYNIHHESESWSATSAWSDGSAIMIRSLESIGGEVIANTIYNCDLGIQSPTAPPNGFDIQHNIISNRAEATGYDINMDTADAAASTFDNNFFYNPSESTIIRWRGGSYNLASFKSSVGKCLDCLEGDPKFVATSQNDFSLQETSPAIDILGGSHSIYTTFYNRYGIDISGGQVSPPDGNQLLAPTGFMFVN